MMTASASVGLVLACALALVWAKRAFAFVEVAILNFELRHKVVHGLELRT